MSKRQISSLFLCNLVLWTIGQGIAPLLTVQAAGLGAGQALGGACLALSMLSMTAGNVSAGWLSGRFRRHRIPALVAGLVATPALWLMGRATTLWGLVMAMAVSFFCAGVVFASNNITAGLYAKGSERGKVFGLLALTLGLGTLLGGGLAGPIAGRWGYASMYTILALFGLLAPLTGLLWEEPGMAPAPKTAAAGKGAGLGRGFYLLFAASLGGAVAGFVFFVGRSFVMTDLGFDAGALTTAAAMFPALMMRLLDFVAIYGFILMPMGAVIFTDFWIFPKLGLKQYFAEFRSILFSWPAALAWVLSLFIGFMLPIEIFFKGLPGWFVASLSYLLLSYLWQNKKKYRLAEDNL